MSLVTHASTARHLEAFRSRPSHALILIGPKGSGKFTLAQQLASEVLETQFDTYPYAATLSPNEKGSISIEAIRELEQFLKLKVPNDKPINRLVIIEDGHTLGVEAQNALLKTFEEPPQGTLIILTATNEQALLPTILSRGQKIEIKRPEVERLVEYFGQQGADETKIKRSLAISGGLPGLTTALLSGEEHPLTEAVAKSRELLGQSTYERLAQVDGLSKQPQLVEDILFILQQMAHLSLQTATGASSEQWQRILTASYSASEALRANGQTKLVLTNLMLSL